MSLQRVRAIHIQMNILNNVACPFKSSCIPCGIVCQPCILELQNYITAGARGKMVAEIPNKYRFIVEYRLFWSNLQL